MYHINMIQKSLDYIEDNLKSELSIIQMTCIAFFSEFERYRALADTNTQMLKWLTQEEAWKKVV